MLRGHSIPHGASEVSFRIPDAMRFFFQRMLDELNVRDFFPNIFPSLASRTQFLLERTATHADPVTGATLPVTDVVIFTGRPHTRISCDALLIAGLCLWRMEPGHNPVVVGADADVASAAVGVTEVAFYNQGQDCAAPSAILVNERIHDEFLHHLRHNVSELRVRIVPQSRKPHRTDWPARGSGARAGTAHGKQKMARSTTAGIICARDATVHPTIVVKPLSEGGNFGELFAPIVFVQRYGPETELTDYFEHRKYARHAMYLSLYGSSSYVDGLVDRPIAGKVIHDRDSILRNTHLHAPGIERGIKPYGGLGPGASSITIDRKLPACRRFPARHIGSMSGSSYMPVMLPRDPATRATFVLQTGIRRIVVRESDTASAQPRLQLARYT